MTSWIRKKRQQRQMTQTNLAKIVGVSTATISNWETGRTVVNKETKALLEMVLL